MARQWERWINIDGRVSSQCDVVQRVIVQRQSNDSDASKIDGSARCKCHVRVEAHGCVDRHWHVDGEMARQWEGWIDVNGGIADQRGVVERGERNGESDKRDTGEVDDGAGRKSHVGVECDGNVDGEMTGQWKRWINVDGGITNQRGVVERRQRDCESNNINACKIHDSTRRKSHICSEVHRSCYVERVVDGYGHVDGQAARQGE